MGVPKGKRPKIIVKVILKGANVNDFFIIFMVEALKPLLANFSCWETPQGPQNVSKSIF